MGSLKKIRQKLFNELSLTVIAPPVEYTPTHPAPYRRTMPQFYHRGHRYRYWSSPPAKTAEPNKVSGLDASISGGNSLTNIQKSLVKGLAGFEQEGSSDTKPKTEKRQNDITVNYPMPKLQISQLKGFVGFDSTKFKPKVSKTEINLLNNSIIFWKHRNKPKVHGHGSLIPEGDAHYAAQYGNAEYPFLMHKVITLKPEQLENGPDLLGQFNPFKKQP